MRARRLALAAYLTLISAAPALAQGVTSTTNGPVQAGTAAKSGAISPNQAKGAPASSAQGQGQGGTMTGTGMTDGKSKGMDGKR